MPIGSVKLNPGTIRPSQPQVSAQNFGQGVATALTTIADSMEDFEDSKLALGEAADQERKRAMNFDARNAWLKKQGEWSRGQVDAYQNAPENGTGLANARYEELEKDRQEFLSTLPPEIRDEFEVQTQETLQRFVTQTYSKEFELRNTYESNEVQQIVGDMAGEIIAGNLSREEGLQIVQNMVETTGLPEAAKTAILDAALDDLASADFSRIISEAAANGGAVHDGTKNDVAAAGLSPWQRGFLNATSKRESGGKYNVRYNGKTPAYFNDYSRHPRIFVPTEHGDVSSAAGRYQITATTWDEYSAKVGVTDFSPASQDLVALAIAEDRFNRQLKAGETTFQQIMESGTDSQILAVKRALAPTWAAFKTMKDREFLEIFKGERGVAGGGTGSLEIPDVWNHPDYANVSFESKNAMSNAASAHARNQLAAAAKEREENANLLRALIAAKDPNVGGQIAEAISKGQIPTDELAYFVGQQVEAQERKANQEAFSSALQTGNAIVSNDQSKEAADSFLTANGVYSGMREQTPEAAELFASTSAQTGIITDKGRGTLTALINSSDPSQQAYGLDILSAMHRKNPLAFANGLPDEMLKMATLWDVSRKYSSAERPMDALQRYREFTDPANSAQREALETEAKKVLRDVSDSDIASHFDQSILPLYGEPTLPAFPQTRNIFRRDFDKLFTQYYAMTGDKAQATEMAAEVMKHSWVAEGVGGVNRLGYLGPSSPRAGYLNPSNPASFRDPQEIRMDILEALELPMDAEFEIVTDAQSEADVARGKTASFLIARKDEAGAYYVHPERLRPTVTAERMRVREAKVIHDNADVQIKRMEKEIEQLHLQSTMHGNPESVKESAKEQMQELGKRVRELKLQKKEAGVDAGVADTSVKELQDRRKETLKRIELYKGTGWQEQMYQEELSRIERDLKRLGE